MDQSQAIRPANTLISIADAAYLTTVDANGYPQTRAMLNLRNAIQYPSLVDFFSRYGNDFTLYFTTNTSSNKMKQIAENPRVSVYYAKPGEWRGLMLGGNIAVVTDEPIKRALWQDAWAIYYPGGTGDPDYTVLCLRPNQCNLYHQLQSFSMRMD